MAVDADERDARICVTKVVQKPGEWPTTTARIPGAAGGSMKEIAVRLVHFFALFTICEHSQIMNMSMTRPPRSFSAIRGPVGPAPAHLRPLNLSKPRYKRRGLLAIDQPTDRRASYSSATARSSALYAL